MPGDETKGYDMVMQFSEQAYNAMLSAMFDQEGFLGLLLDKLEDSVPLLSIPREAFTLEVLFDRPSDVTLPSNAENPVELRIGLGEATQYGSIRIIAGVEVAPQTALGMDLDVVRINFEDKTYHASMTLLIAGIPISDPGVLQSVVQSMSPIPLLPVPVARNTTSPLTIKSVEAAIIDDTLSADCDASAVLFTFGGGISGDKAGFTRSFIPLGKTGGLAIDFDWLCRVIRPRLAQALGINESDFDSPCKLNKSFVVDEEEDVKLTKLELTLKDGFIQIEAKVRKDGTGYEATGEVKARISIRVEAGNLVVESEVDDPDIDVDVEWWLWLLAAILGTVIGGVIAGLIGMIIGAILVPLIVYIATEVIEGTLENVAAQIADAVDDLDFSAPAVGFNLIFQEAFIDDITLGLFVDVEDRSPVKCEGTVNLANGQRLDLDTGGVGDEAQPGADLALDDSLRTLCNVGIARTQPLRSFSVPRYKMYQLSYESPASLSRGEMLGNGSHRPVYAVRTDEQRYSIIKAMTPITDSLILKFKTFEKQLPTCRIVGNLKVQRLIPADLSEGFVSLGDLSARKVGLDAADYMHGFAHAGLPVQRISTTIPILAVASTEMCQEVKSLPFRLDRYCKQVEFVTKRGVFEALVRGLKKPLSYEWFIDDRKLDSPSDTVDVNGVTINYEIDEYKIALHSDSKFGASFLLKVRVTDSEHDIVQCTRCIEIPGAVPLLRRATLSWNDFRLEYLAENRAVQMVGPFPDEG